MASTTYRKFSEEILTAFYQGQRSDDATYTQRYIAELIANEIAFYARKNAFENSAAGELAYANDTFITTYKSIPVLTDPVLKQKYVPLPSTPAALPNNQEIEKVWPTGSRKVQIIPIGNRSKFSQDMLPALRGVITYYIENNNLIFDNNISAYSFSAVNINMVAGFPEGNLMDAILSVPKSYEPEIMDKILSRLNAQRGKIRDVLNDSEPTP